MSSTTSVYDSRRLDRLARIARRELRKAGYIPSKSYYLRVGTLTSLVVPYVDAKTGSTFEHGTAL